MKYREFVRHLKRYGCYLLRQGAKHEVWCNAINGNVTMVPRHKTLDRFLCKGICKQLEVPAPF